MCNVYPAIKNEFTRKQTISQDLKQIHYRKSRVITSSYLLQSVLQNCRFYTLTLRETECCVSRPQKIKFLCEEIPAEEKPSMAELWETRPYKVLLRFNLMIHSFFLPPSVCVTQAKLHEAVSEQPAHSAAAPPPPPPPKASSEERKQRWEAGQMDYMGDDSFANIERKLDSFLK